MADIHLKSWCSLYKEKMAVAFLLLRKLAERVHVSDALQGVHESVEEEGKTKTSRISRKAVSYGFLNILSSEVEWNERTYTLGRK